MAHIASPSFDLSINEMLLAFTAGATLVIVPPGVLTGDELADVLRRERVTHVMVTPSVLASLEPSSVPDLQVIDLAGEELPWELAQRWAPGRIVVNGYGPTETTIVNFMSNPLTPGGPLTIGGPIEGTEVLVLDSRLRPVPVGVTGEVYLAGESLGRGYHGRSGLTAERFIAYPSGDGTRMYRSGDWPVDALARTGDRGARRQPGEGPRVPGGTGRGGRRTAGGTRRRERGDARARHHAGVVRDRIGGTD